MNGIPMENTSTNYIVSLQKPTAVTSAAVGYFRNEEEIDLIIARINRIEHFLVTAEGLKPYREIPIFGRIATMNAFRLPGEKLDSIVVLTVKHHMAILNFDEKGIVQTRASGNVSERVGRFAETGIITCVHESGLIATRIYEGQLKVIQWEDDRDLKQINLKFEDITVTDVVFLEDTETPTIAYFYQDGNGRHLKVCLIDINEREIKSLWKQENVASEATLLIPVPPPTGGLVIVGREYICYQKSETNYTSIAQPHVQVVDFLCYGRIDKTGERFLLGDRLGRLFLLLLVKDDETMEIKDMKIEYLGEISIPSALVYLDNSVAFVGSHFGDSQLIRLSTEPDLETNSFLQIIDVFTNLGPIRDLTIMNCNGQNQIITASGAFKDGSLRIVRSGIGIDEMATIELNGVRSMFTLKSNSALDNYIVVSFSDVSHLFRLDNEDMEDCQLTDFDLSSKILYAGNIRKHKQGAANRILQINQSVVKLISGDGTFSTAWNAPVKISLASVNSESGQIIVASGQQIYYLQIDEDDEIRLVQHIQCTNEVACVDISPLERGKPSKYFAVGFWQEHSVALYSINEERSGVQKLCEEKIGTEFLPRSLLIATLEETSYLFIALGDGTLYYYQIARSNGTLTSQKKVTLGTQPISLHKFLHKDVDNIFICSDRPTVIYSSNHKLMYSNVNLKMVTEMCPLNSNYYHDCLILSDGENLTIGTIDDIQKLHIRTVPMGEAVSRVVYQPETNTIGVLVDREEYVMPNGERISRQSVSTTGPKASAPGCDNILCTDSLPSTSCPPQPREDNNTTYEETDIYSFCLLDGNTFECLSVFEFNTNECGCSLASLSLGNDPTPYYAIGTAIGLEEDMDSKLGRILVFQATAEIDAEIGGGRLRLVTEKEVKGAVFSIECLNNKLICSVNTTVRLFEWTPERELRLECSCFNFTTALYLKTKGDLVLVGDLMRSITVISYKCVDSSFEELARDYQAQWMTACEILDSENFLGAENDYNLFCCRKDLSAEMEEDKARLQQVGSYYLGEMVNVFKRGAIISTHNDANRQTPYECSILYGTADGSIGAIISLHPKFYLFCYELQKRIATKTHNCLRIEHNVFRSFFTERRTDPCTGFVDGDLIESLMEMPKETVAEIVEGMKLPYDDHDQGQAATAEEVLKVVEDLSQTH